LAFTIISCSKTPVSKSSEQVASPTPPQLFIITENQNE
jgi:hypothetical protein